MTPLASAKSKLGHCRFARNVDKLIQQCTKVVVFLLNKGLYEMVQCSVSCSRTLSHCPFSFWWCRRRTVRRVPVPHSKQCWLQIVSQKKSVQLAEINQRLYYLRSFCHYTKCVPLTFLPIANQSGWKSLVVSKSDRFSLAFGDAMREVDSAGHIRSDPFTLCHADIVSNLNLRPIIAQFKSTPIYSIFLLSHPKQNSSQRGPKYPCPNTF